MSTMDDSINESTLISAIIEAVLYVVYLATLAYGLRWLVYDDEGKSVRKKINWLMLSVTILTFVLMTLSLALDVFTSLKILAQLPESAFIASGLDLGLIRVRRPEAYGANLD